jgi:outer membrane protein assembly factor BamD (BamD/ComL family)
MSNHPLPSELQTALLDALRAYELARATRLRAEWEARAARQEREEALRAEEARARQDLEAERRAEESVLRAEQERLGHLQAAIDGVEAAARALLEKAGLAYIAGAPAAPTGRPSAPRRADADAAQAFAEAQTAYADLRLALVTLAQAHLEAGRWEDARRVLQPLLEDTRAPLYAEAHDLLAESYYRPACAALEAGQWAVARQGFAEALKINSAYRDAAMLEREAYLRPARAALEAGCYDDARPPLEAWLKAHKDDAEARDLLAESHYRPALAALEAGQWEAARQGFAEVLKINPAYRDAAMLEREAYLRPARAALEAGCYDDARPPLEAWLKAHNDDTEARDLLAESHYRPALAALEAGQWEAARKGFAEVLKVNPAYRDAAALEREAHLRPARVALEANHYAEVPAHLEPWWKAHKDDAEARDLLAESYYRPALAAIQAQQWEQAGEALRALWQVNAKYRDITTWVQNFPVVFWWAGIIHVNIEIELIYSVKSVSFSPDSQLLAIATKEYSVATSNYGGDSGVYDPETGYLRYKLAWRKAFADTKKEAYAERVTFSKDGKYIVAQIDLYKDRLVAWNACTGEEVAYNETSLPKTGNPRVSPDGRLKAVIDGVNIKIVDASTGRLLHTLGGHRGMVTDVAFSPDGRLLASASANTVKIWGPA